MVTDKLPINTDVVSAFIIARLGEIHDDIGGLYDEINALKGQGLLTRSDCEHCQEKKHGVSPRIALAATTGAAIFGGLLQKIHWAAVLQFLKGG